MFDQNQHNISFSSIKSLVTTIWFESDRDCFDDQVSYKSYIFSFLKLINNVLKTFRVPHQILLYLETFGFALLTPLLAIDHCSDVISLRSFSNSSYSLLSFLSQQLSLSPDIGNGPGVFRCPWFYWKSLRKKWWKKNIWRALCGWTDPKLWILDLSRISSDCLVLVSSLSRATTAMRLKQINGRKVFIMESIFSLALLCDVGSTIVHVNTMSVFDVMPAAILELGVTSLTKEHSAVFKY